MHDIRLIRDDPEGFDAALARRGEEGFAADLLEIDARRRSAIHAAEEAQAAMNRASKEIGAAKGRGDEAEFQRLRAMVADKKTEQAELEEKARIEAAQLEQLMMMLPNRPLDDVPDGADEADNVELKRWGTPRTFDFPPLEHYQIGGVAAGMDFETAARLSGARFVLMSGAVARVHRALAQFMLDTHGTRNGLTEAAPPVLVREEAMQGTGQLPKFGEDSYRTTDGWWLIPTAEVPLTNIAAGQIVDDATLPADLSRTRSASAPRRAAPGATPPACCASTSSRRSRWCRSPAPRTAAPSLTA